MNGLWQKEMKALRPFLILILIIFGMDLLSIVFTGYPDQTTLPQSLSLLDDELWSTMPIITFLLALSLGSGLLVGEKDGNTIHFLDGLPTSRTRIFLTKILCAWLVLFMGPLVMTGSGLVFHLMSRTSLNGSLYLALLTNLLVLHGCQIFILLALSLVFSFLRRFGWILAALAVITYQVLFAITPEVVLINPIELTRPVFEGMDWVLPLDALAVQMPIACILMLIAWTLFRGNGLDLSRKITDLNRNLGGRILLGCGSFLVFILWSGLFIWIVMDDDEGEDPDVTRVTWEEWKPVRIHTEHYLFSVPTVLTQRARPMIEQADQIHETVRSFLGAETMPQIMVDGSVISPGHAGLAFWETIKISLPALDESSDHIATLAHETTHVYIEKLSEGRMGKHFQSTRWFHEGLAEYVERRFFRGSFDDLHFRAAVHYDRDEADMDLLVDNMALTGKLDADIVYALGERFITALIQLYGDAAPGKLMKAMGREDAPQNLTGARLWRDTFLAARFDFDKVVDAWNTLLDGDQTRYRQQIDELPRLYGAVEVKGDEITIQTESDRADQHRIICRVRQNAETPAHLYGYPKAGEERIFKVNRADYPTMDFQLGLLMDGYVIYEPWSTVHIDR